MICHKNKIIFIHLEKTGGTSFANFFTDKEWWHIINKNLKKMRYDSGHEKHMKYSVAKKIYAKYIKKYKIVTIVRDPMTLFISKYLFFYKHNRDIVNTKKIKININHVNKMIDSNKKRWKINKLYDFHQDKNYYNFIIKFETYEKDFKKMCKKFKIKFSKKKLKKINNQEMKYFNREITLSKAAIKKIKEYSKEYCEAFGYNYD